MRPDRADQEGPPYRARELRVPFVLDGLNRQANAVGSTKTHGNVENDLTFFAPKALFHAGVGSDHRTRSVQSTYVLAHQSVPRRWLMGLVSPKLGPEETIFCEPRFVVNFFSCIIEGKLKYILDFLKLVIAGTLRLVYRREDPL